MSSVPPAWIKQTAPSNVPYEGIGRLVVRREGEVVLEVTGILHPVPCYQISGPGVFKRILEVGIDPLDEKQLTMTHRRFASNPETRNAIVRAVFDGGTLIAVQRDCDRLELTSPLEYELWVVDRWGSV